MAVQTQIQTRRGTAASWTSTNPTLAAGEIGFESDTGKIKIGNGSTAWNALAYTASSTAVTYLFNATGGQTTFSGTDANGLTLAYTVGAEQVYLNGVLQVRGSDYTASNGTSIVLTSGALVSDVLNVIAFSALSLSDTYTQAQADAKFFQNANAFVAGKNKIINGDFYWNQRSFSSTTTNGEYGFDRWTNGLTTGGGTVTFSAQTFTLGTAPVVGYEGTNFFRCVTSGQVNTDARAQFRQNIESVRTLAGQTATISFWAKAASGTPSLNVEMLQVFGSGGSPSASVSTVGTKQAITTSWVRYSFTVAIPSISGKTLGTAGDMLRLNIWASAGSTNDAASGTLGIQNNTFDIWGVQVEAGSIATAFQTATGTIQGELAACQRYYQLLASGLNKFLAVASVYTASQLDLLISFPEMRVAPSLVATSGTGYYTLIRNGGGDNFNSLTLNGYTTTRGAALYNNTEISSTAGNAGWVYTDNASASVALSAEL